MNEQKITHLFIFLLVCRIFSWGEEGPAGITPEINEWLKGKKIVSTEQTAIGFNRGLGNYAIQTYLTIIAEEL